MNSDHDTYSRELSAKQFVDSQRLYAPTPPPLALCNLYPLNFTKQLLVGLDSNDSYTPKIHMLKTDTPRNAITITREDWTFLKDMSDTVANFFKGDHFAPTISPRGTLQVLMSHRMYKGPTLVLAHDNMSQIFIQSSTWNILLRLMPLIDAHFAHLELVGQAMRTMTDAKIHNLDAEISRAFSYVIREALLHCRLQPLLQQNPFKKQGAVQDEFWK